MATFAVVEVFVEYAPTLYLAGQIDAPVLTPLVYLHGAAFTTTLRCRPRR